MNLVILHGNGLSSILDKIATIKKDYDSTCIIEISGKEISVSQAILSLLTPSLFSSKRLYILENFDETFDLEKLPKDSDLLVVIKFSKALAANGIFLKTAIKLKSQIIFFGEEKEISIFPFLDYLTEKNPKALLFLNKLLNEYGSQYILTMLFYMFRRLILAPKNLSSFNLRKIKEGGKNYPCDKINFFYQEIITTDFKIKSGIIDEEQGLTSLVYRILA